MEQTDLISCGHLTRQCGEKGGAHVHFHVSIGREHPERLRSVPRCGRARYNVDVVDGNQTERLGESRSAVRGATGDVHVLQRAPVHCGDG